MPATGKPRRSYDVGIPRFPSLFSVREGRAGYNPDRYGAGDGMFLGEYYRDPYDKRIKRRVHSPLGLPGGLGGGEGGIGGPPPGGPI